jgi:Ca-activated chloride channel family protein
MGGVVFLRPEWGALLVLALLAVVARRRWLRFNLCHPHADGLPACGLRRPGLWPYVPQVLDWGMLALLTGALAQPVLPVGQRRTTIQALDIVLCVDLSASMGIPLEPQPAGAVFPLLGASGPSRMEAVREVALDFVRNRVHDRIGLVVFSANAYVVNPLTSDHTLLSQYLRMVDNRTLISEGLTSVGAGLEMANQLLDFFRGGQTQGGKVIIVLTDAEQNYGTQPDAPLETARQSDTRVYFIGVGEPVEDILLGRVDLVRATGGGAYNAASAADLRRISYEIDRLERNRVQVTEYFRNQRVDTPLLLTAVACLLGAWGLRSFRAFYLTG